MNSVNSGDAADQVTVSGAAPGLDVRFGPNGLVLNFRLPSHEGSAAAAAAPSSPAVQQRLFALDESSMDRFWRDWTRQCLPVLYGPVRTEALYAAYSHWCELQGVTDAAPIRDFSSFACGQRGSKKSRTRYVAEDKSRVQTTVLFPSGSDATLSGDQLGTTLMAFDRSLTRWVKVTQKTKKSSEELL